ncbi:MAG TPA: hypothetical protein VLA17_02075 [Candidatus Limnocylindria bacterium]|nr:hypothetical protein [Candidatus Limnocylindria bacterium]
MVWVKAAFLTSLLSTLLLAPAVDATAADWGRRNDCRRGDRIQIQDLDISPDPAVEGQRIRSWKVRLRFDGKRECDTDVLIREGNNIVGHERNFQLRPGINEIDLRPAGDFRFRGREHCFNVQVDLDGSRQQIDADRRFCARQRTMWTMRESDDRGGLKR